MQTAKRKLAFVLASTGHGTMILSRFDHHTPPMGEPFGVGQRLLETSMFDPGDITLAVQLLQARRQHHGDGVVVLDCGANIGVHTVEWAIAMTGWGKVIGIEAQERVFYALAGNIAINNVFNATAMHAAVAASSGVMKIPTPDYFAPASLGSLELKRTAAPEYIGQVIDYSDAALSAVRMVALDDLGQDRVDLIKIDIEGMELEALEGAQTLIARHHPILIVESVKVNQQQLTDWLAQRGYKVMGVGMNVVAIHQDDPTLAAIRFQEKA
jgi:FkbM family methyltransferase